MFQPSNYIERLKSRQKITSSRIRYSSEEPSFTRPQYNDDTIHLINHILDNPRDDTAYLVLADSLQESGAEEAADYLRKIVTTSDHSENHQLISDVFDKGRSYRDYFKKQNPDYIDYSYVLYPKGNAGTNRFAISMYSWTDAHSLPDITITYDYENQIVDRYRNPYWYYNTPSSVRNRFIRETESFNNIQTPFDMIRWMLEKDDNPYVLVGKLSEMRDYYSRLK